MKKSAKSKALVLARIKDNAKEKPHTWSSRKRGPWDRAHKAGGGAVDDWVTPAADDWVTPKATTPDNGKLDAAWQGAKAGATFNFNDELAGARAAAPANVPELVGPIPARAIAGAGRLAYEHFAGGDKPGTAAYEKARDEERAAAASAKEHHPYIHTAGEVAGSIPAMAAMPEAAIVKGAGLGKRMLQGAQVGAEYGALAGAGEGKDGAERATGAATGAGSGVVGGAIAPVLGSVAGAAYDKFGKPIVNAVRGAMNPEAEAARRLATALRADQELIAAGKAEGMSPQDWAKARAAGEPVTLADLGASNTQALLRSSANTSPEGRAILEKTLQDRFTGQTERVADEVRTLVAGGANARKSGDQLVAEYDVARAPAYKAAFNHPKAQSLWDGDFEQMAQAPAVQNAIRMATVNAKDEAAKLGMKPPANPFAFNKDGTVSLTDPNFKPNLQFWDVVKKNLDQSGREGQQWAKILRDKLDSYGTGYDRARGIASTFFGERDALQAGRSLAGKNTDPEVIADVMRKMNPAERDLFREGYASDWANRVIGNMRDSRDITKAMFNSPNERKRAEVIFGPAGLKTIETRMTLETIMDGARKAMGNSTTARQLIEAGLAGGALGGYLDGDWKGALAGAASGAGARKALATEMASGARKLIGSVDNRTAKLVAELLTSDDPAKLKQGLRMAAKNQKIADGLRNLASRVALAGQNKAMPRVPIDTTGWGRLQGPVPAGAESEQQ